MWMWLYRTKKINSPNEKRAKLKGLVALISYITHILLWPLITLRD